MNTKELDIDKFEIYIISFKNEKENKKKHILYLKLVEESLKLVKKIVAQMYPLPSEISQEDLVQVGAIGMLKAIDLYKPLGKGSFKNYASKFIKGRILQYLRDKKDLVKIPRQSGADVIKVKNCIEKWNNNGLTPSCEEIAKFTNLSINAVKDILNAENIKNIVSLDQKVYSIDGIETLLDRIQTDENESYEEIFENRTIIEYALNKLEQLEKNVIYKYYVEGLTKKNIAVIYGLSQMQVARIIKRALNKMYLIITNVYKECL